MLPSSIHQRGVTEALAQTKPLTAAGNGREPSSELDESASFQQALGNRSTGKLRSSAHAAELSPAAPVGSGTVESALAGMLVEDAAVVVGPGAMRKTQFLGSLRASICSAADTVLTSTGRSTTECPYLDYWFDYYGRRNARHVARAIARYAPESAGASTAVELIAIVTARARRAVEIWVRTGRITGVPDGAPGGAPEMMQTPAEPEAGLFFRARSGGARNPDNPQQVRQRLGYGHPLDGAVRSRMEPVFGADLSHVRVHADSDAGALSENLNARAFAVGEHIAFGAGEYHPGTPAGDALIAHELAHVMQQNSAARPESTASAYGGLEEDADRSASATVSSLWGAAKHGLANIALHAAPRLRSGLRLQRCPKAQAPRKPSPESGSKAIAACGATFTLENQRATGAKPGIDIDIGLNGTLNILEFVRIDGGHVNYEPKITIHAGSDDKAREFEVGLIQNMLSEKLEYTFDSGGPLRSKIPTPIKDGAESGSREYDEVFASTESDTLGRFSADDGSVTLKQMDVPRDAAFVNLKDNPECAGAGANGVMTRGVLQDKFRTWIGVRNKGAGCVTAIHHIDWDTDFSADVRGAPAHPVSAITGDAIRVTEPDGDGSPHFIRGGKVPADFLEAGTDKRCGP